MARDCSALRRSLYSRRGAGSIALIALLVGVLIAVAVVLMAWWLEPDPTRAPRRHRDIDVTELLTPDAPTTAERESASDVSNSASVLLEEGAWVQVADDEGKLKQQYSAERIEPLPDGWLEMERPRAMMYLGGGRVLSLRAEHGLLSAPDQAIESGMLEGDVVIRLFVPQHGEVVEIGTTPPAMIVRTEEASFDSLLSEVRCAKGVRINSADASFAGEGLTMLLAEDGSTRSVERLLIERATEPIVIHRRARIEQEPQPAQQGQSQQQASPAPSETRPPQFYTLELERNVFIERFDNANDSEPSLTLRGPTLNALFSLDGESADGLLEANRVHEVPSPAHALAGALDAQVASTVFAAQAAGDEELIKIYYEGRLLMSPIAPDAAPQSADDVRVQMSGPGRAVEVFDAASGALVRAGTLQYDRRSDHLAITSEPGLPVQVASPKMSLECAALVFARATGDGVLDGKGWMRFEREEGKTQIDWSDGVDLAFSPGTDTLEEARFKGDVSLNDTAFELFAETLDVELGQDAEGGDTIERVLATAAAGELARARSLDTKRPGALDARTIELVLRPGSDDRLMPEILEARGSVKAQDAEQTLLTNSLSVRFLTPQTGNDDAVAVDRVRAHDGVQVILRDGTNVWADSLNGSGPRETVRLSAPKRGVRIVRGNVFADELSAVEFKQRERTAYAEGPGRFRYYQDPLAMQAGGPMIEGRTPSMEVTWAKGMTFNDNANNGGGKFELDGDIVVRNRADLLETSDLDADHLVLLFEDRGELAAVDARGEVRLASEREAFAASRDLRSVYASGQARMETRSWPDTAAGRAHEGDPNLFRISGDEILYDTVTGEGEVRGAGRLLVHELPVATSHSGDPGPGPSPSGIAIGGDGTSRFTWTDGMTMRHQVANRYLVTMEGDVQLLHAGSRSSDVLTLSAHTLEVLMDRSNETDAGQTQTQVAALDIGSQAELLRVQAIGRVFIRTAQEDIECERFDYDAANQIAQLASRDGRLLSVLRHDSPAPIRAESVVWDMKTGRMQITAASG